MYGDCNGRRYNWYIQQLLTIILHVKLLQNVMPSFNISSIIPKIAKKFVIVDGPSWSEMTRLSQLIKMTAMLGGHVALLLAQSTSSTFAWPPA